MLIDGEGNVVHILFCKSNMYEQDEAGRNMNTDKPLILDDLIRKHALKSPDKTAIFFEDESISYGEFYDDAGKAARMLLGFGIDHGDRIGFMFPNRPEILFLYFACFQIGAIAVPVNTRYQKQEIEYALDHSECRILIVDKIFRSHLTSGMLGTMLLSLVFSNIKTGEKARVAE